MHRLQRVPPGTVIYDLQVPDTSGLAEPLHRHKMDVYIPSGTVTRCLVGLGGAGSDKWRFARKLKIGLDKPKTPQRIPVRSVNWSLLTKMKAMIIIPQAQAPIGVDPFWGAGNNPYNPDDVDTRSTKNPNGVTTWRNQYMISGVDDLQMLKNLSSYIDDHWDVQKVLFGHSNGAMMTNRVWWEAPNAFAAYAAAAGNLAAHYDDPGVVANAAWKPMFTRTGRKDTIIDVLGGPQANSPMTDHTFDANYLQNQTQLSKAHVSFPTLSYIWGSCREYQFRRAGIGAPLSAPITSTSSAGGVTTAVHVGTQTRWDSPNKQQRLEFLSDADHNTVKDRSVSGRFYIADVVQWCQDWQQML
jgi:hypothetical protein